jgi:hypothetical protein
MLTEYTHQWPVVQLAWTRLAPLGDVLASTSADGRMLIWTPANKLAAPVMGFDLSASRAGAPENNNNTTLRAVKPGGSASLGFSPLDPTTFVVGLEAGRILKCGLHSNEERTVEMTRRLRGEVPWTDAAAALMTHVPVAAYHRLKLRVEKECVLARAKEVTAETVFAAQPAVEQLYHSPTTFSYEPHGGPVYGVAFSPFHRNVFLTVSTDSTVRVYNVLQPRPLLVLEPCSGCLYACCWSPSRPSVFAVGAADGQMYIYDLRRNKGKPVRLLFILFSFKHDHQSHRADRTRPLTPHTHTQKRLNRALALPPATPLPPGAFPQSDHRQDSGIRNRLQSEGADPIHTHTNASTPPSSTSPTLLPPSGAFPQSDHRQDSGIRNRLQSEGAERAGNSRRAGSGQNLAAVERALRNGATGAGGV